MITSIIKGSAIVGAATLGTALGLQQLYALTGIYPPQPVFLFFSGALAYAAIEGFEHLIGKELLETGHGLSYEMET